MCGLDHVCTVLCRLLDVLHRTSSDLFGGVGDLVCGGLWFMAVKLVSLNPLVWSRRLFGLFAHYSLAISVACPDC